MEFRLDNAEAVLARTPQVIRSLLEGLPEEWMTATDGADTWSPVDVLGHLIHAERTDWIPRARIILEAGEKQTFEPFDREAQFSAPPRSVKQLLDDFEDLRAGNLRTLSQMALSPEDLKKTGMHPELGRVTLEQLLATWMAHDLGHIVQVSRTMASQLGEAVGPWRAYLSVLR